MCKLAVILLFWAASAAAQQVIAITGATVIDGTGAAPRKETVLMRGDRIDAAGPDIAVPPGARVIDASGQTLLPGLFDLHTHISTLGDWIKNLRAYLYCGVTTIADLGAYPEQYEPVRRLLASGAYLSPHLIQGARFSTPGGHGAEGGRGDFHTHQMFTPAGAKAAMRSVLPYQPGIIKIFTDGWRYDTAPNMSSMEEGAIAAIVEEAHKAGVKVITHTVTVERAKIAARAGVDIIGHGLGNGVVDDELLGLMRSKGIAYVQTLSVFEPSKRRSGAYPMLKEVLEPAVFDALRPSTSTTSRPTQLRWQNLMENCRRALKAGVLLASGTDAGMTGTYHGSASLHELFLMVEGGLTPLEAITAATGNSAKALGLAGERGVIETGKLADLVLVDGAPHENIKDLARVSRVFLGGKEVDRSALSRAIAAPGPTSIPPIIATALLDDFEQEDGRSRLGTLWMNRTDSGQDTARMSYQRTLREPGNHALTILAEMSANAETFAAMILPLSKASLEPVDASGFQGIEFEARGDGSYELTAPGRSETRGKRFHAAFSAAPKWSLIRLPFSGARREDLTALEFIIRRAPRVKSWLEIDNVRFY